MDVALLLYSLIPRFLHDAVGSLFLEYCLVIRPFLLVFPKDVSSAILCRGISVRRIDSFNTDFVLSVRCRCYEMGAFL